MSRRKAFLLRIEIDVHSVDCPGLSFCRSGNVAIRVHTLSSAAVTTPGYLPFPIHVHEALVFEKVLDFASNLSEIQDFLNRESIRMEFLYWPSHTREERVIAEFRTKLSSVLFPTLINTNPDDAGRITLLMETAEKHTAPPRVEVSTKISIDEKSATPEIRKVAPSCRCWASDRCRRMRNNKRNGSDVRWRHENCSICNRYSGYFGSKCGSSGKHWYTSEVEKPTSHRQQFYENLEYFYGQLLKNSAHLPLNEE